MGRWEVGQNHFRSNAVKAKQLLAIPGKRARELVLAADVVLLALVAILFYLTNFS